MLLGDKMVFPVSTLWKGNGHPNHAVLSLLCICNIIYALPMYYNLPCNIFH